MNGINNIKVCSNGERDAENDDDEEDLARPSTSRAGLSEEDLAQPSTSCSRLPEEPKWNTSTRQLYEDNLKSNMPHSSGKQVRLPPRERLPSISDSSNESDDSCVYMYTGEGAQRNGVDVNKQDNCSSPEMDYLEMDFDPCQSNGHDSSDGSYGCDASDFRDEEGTVPSSSYLNLSDSHDEERNETPVSRMSRSPSPSASRSLNVPFGDAQASTSSLLASPVVEPSEGPIRGSNENNNHVAKVVLPASLDANRGALVQDASCSSLGRNNGSSPSCNDLLPIESERGVSEHHLILKKHLNEGKGQYNPKYGFVQCCGSTLSRAVCKLNTEEVTIEGPKEELVYSMGIAVTELLIKMSKGYFTVPKVQEMIMRASNGEVKTRFFQANSSILLNLSSWIHYWLKKDAVIVLCLNFHLSDDDCPNVVNASWHYQLVEGVNSKGVQLFSQSEAIPEDILKKLFLNPSEVLTMKYIIVAHWTPNTTLKPLLNNSDHSWRRYNVLGQVVNAIRENMTGRTDDEVGYIKVPSPHRTGILILMRSDNIHLRELLDSDETVIP